MSSLGNDDTKNQTKMSTRSVNEVKHFKYRN